MFSQIDFKGKYDDEYKRRLLFRVETYIILSPYGGDDADEDDVV